MSRYHHYEPLDLDPSEMGEPSLKCANCDRLVTDTACFTPEGPKHLECMAEEAREAELDRQAMDFLTRPSMEVAVAIMRHAEGK